MQPKPGVTIPPAHSSENAIRNEIHGREELTGIEEPIGGSFERLSSENLRLSRAVQAFIALVEALSKTVLTCVPESMAEASSQAVALAKERYHRLIQSAAAAMSGNSRPVLDLFSAVPTGPFGFSHESLLLRAETTRPGHPATCVNWKMLSSGSCCSPPARRSCGQIWQSFLRCEEPETESLYLELLPYGISLEAVEKELIQRAPEKFGWKERAASFLDISRRTLIDRMGKPGIH
jgi:hypothetical protein